MAAAATRVATGIRDLRADEASFTLEAYAESAATCLAVARRLSSSDDPNRPPATESDLGIGRRAYAPIGGKQLRGFVSEVVATTSGYAGVVTYLRDDDGRTWTVSDVAPGDPSRAGVAYRSAVRFGTLAVQHDELGRSRVFGQGLTASRDGRLGSGQSVRVSRGGESSWDDRAIVASWTEPFDAQAARAFAALEEPPELRTPDASLLYLDAVVVGDVGGGLDLHVRNAAKPVRCGAASAGSDPSGASTSNLRLLAGMVGAPLRFVGQLVADQPRTVVLLAVGPAADPEGGDDAAPPGPSLRLPDSWRGRANLGFDRLSQSFIVDAEGHVTSFGTDDDREGPGGTPSEDGTTGDPRPDHWSLGEDPLEPLVRLLRRAASGRAQSTLGSGSHPAVSRATRALTEELPTAASLLLHLEATAHETRRSITGEQYVPPPDEFARA